MKLVSENSEAEFARTRYEAEIRWALRNLTANLIRITRGAGKPYEIVRQVDELARALRGYHDALGHWPRSDELENALAFDLRKLSASTHPTIKRFITRDWK